MRACMHACMHVLDLQMKQHVTLPVNDIVPFTFLTDAGTA